MSLAALKLLEIAGTFAAIIAIVAYFNWRSMRP